MQSALKRFESTLLNLLITHSFIYESKGAGGGTFLKEVNQPAVLEGFITLVAGRVV